jgi:hypothetical protein
MRATITIPDERLEELMDAHGRSVAHGGDQPRDRLVRATSEAPAASSHSRGSVDILSNDEIEALDASEQRGPWNAIERSAARG